MTDRIIELHLQGLGRYKISQATGVSEKRVRTIIAKYKNDKETEAMPNGIDIIEYQNGNLVRTKDIYVEKGILIDEQTAMRLCKIDPAKFDVISLRASLYPMGAKIDDKIVTKDRYALKVTAKPKKNALDFDWQREKIAQFKPVEIIRTTNNGHGLVEVFLTDMHFGINTFEDYEQTLQNVLNLLPGYDTLALALGSDNIHVNGHKNMTINGTQLEEVDINKAFDDAVKFFANIITHALNQGMTVNTFYIPANHDYDLSWTVCKTLERMFPDAKIDTVMYQYKAMRYGNVALGFTHGDEGRNFDRTFMREFPEIFGTAEVLEVHSGHIHRETVEDQSGVMVRTLPTGTKRTDWTKKKGYHSVRRFQVFGYIKDELKNIYYV